jgi:predicted amidohydrolase YtcJ
VAAEVSSTLITGATVWAGPACTPRRAWLLLDGGRIAGTGTGPPPAAGQVLDLPGCHVLPGFTDVHLHLTQAAWYPHGGGAWRWRGLAGALDAVRAAAAADPAAPWLLFWDAARWRWPEGRLPTARELDAAAPGRRVLIATADMHRGAVSTAGLAAAGLPARGAGGSGDDITRDRRGRPTGEVWEAAFGIALQRALADTEAHFGSGGALLAAQARRCLALGITHAHDPYVPPDWHEQMAALRSATPLRLSWATGPAAGMHSPAPGPDTAPAGPYGDSGREVKLFADGGDRCALRLPSRAALGLLGGAVQQSLRLRHPGPLREALRRKLVIRPRHVHTPYLRYADTDLARLMDAYAGAGIRMRIHALGNLAGAQAARLLQQVGVPPALATIDHLMLLDPATADRVAATGAAVCYQPGFIPRYGDMLTGMRVDRYAAVLGGRRLLQAGVPLVLSSDHPSGPLDPLANLRAAVDRKYPGGELQPGQALSREQAVRAATASAAASLAAPGAGGIQPGQPADLAICDGDPFAPATHVIQTWVAGTAAWSSEPAGHP